MESEQISIQFSVEATTWVKDQALDLEFYNETHLGHNGT